MEPVGHGPTAQEVGLLENSFKKSTPLQVMALIKALLSAQSQAPSLPGVALPSSHDGGMQL